MNCKLVKKTTLVTDKTGVSQYFTNFYLIFDNGEKVAIKPSFKNGFYSLKSLASKVNDNENK